MPVRNRRDHPPSLGPRGSASPGGTHFEITTRSPEETRKMGRRLGRVLRSGDVLLLIADLGVGKTTFVQGAAEGVGVDAPTLSPTFVLAQTLTGRIPFHHLDFYRLTKQEILNVGVMDYLTGAPGIPPGTVLIEWADRFPELWPAGRLEIRGAFGHDSQTRRWSLTAKGERHRSILASLRRSR